MTGTIITDTGAGRPFTYWQEPSGWWLGYADDYPDYWTQGETPDELRENVADIVRDIEGAERGAA